jgi:DNA-binding Lrp family transcriptional regulator
MEEKRRDYGWTQGEESEEKVRKVVEELKVEGKIKDFGQSLKFYLEDKAGIDFVIITNDGKLILIQVKSSLNQADKKEYEKRGIYYLGGVREKTPEEIKKEILEILQQKGRLQKTSIKGKIEVPI